MAKRCCDTHFYVGGHKTRSGNARYAAPDGTELAVVCGRNRPGPGQIHLRDVPDHSMLHVTGHGGELFLPLDQSASRGRSGRIDIYELPLGERDQRAVALNNLMELPAHHADRRWASRTVAFWIENGGVNGKLRPGTAGHADVVLQTNGHRFVTLRGWHNFSYASYDAEDIAKAHLKRVFGQVCGMDPAADRRAFDTALRELVEILPVHGLDIPPEYFERLTALLADEAVHIGAGPLRQLINGVSPEYSLDLIARMVATHGVANAATTRALGAALMNELLHEVNIMPTDRAWLCLGVLANERLAPWHEEIVTSPDELPDYLVPAAYRLATPAAAEMLAARRPAGVAINIANFKRPPVELPPRAAPATFAQNLARTPADAFPARASLPHEERVAKARLVNSGDWSRLRDWDDDLRTRVPRFRRPPSGFGLYEYLVDDEISSFSQLSRLARYGITARDIGPLEEAGARTTAQKITCGIRNVHAKDLEEYAAAGVHGLSAALEFASHNVRPRWVPLFQELDVTDPARMQQLGDLDVSPAGLAAFGLAGRTCDEALQSAARGVPGYLCLALAAADVDDPSVQARVCRNSRGYVEAMARSGLVGDSLVEAIDGEVPWLTAVHIVEQDIPVTEVIKGLASGIEDEMIWEYARAGVRSARGWKLLVENEIDPEKARFLTAAGVETVSEMLPFAKLPIDSVESARACIAARSRSTAVSANSTAAAMVG